MSCINHSKTATACCSIHATLGNWLQRAFLFPILTLLLHRKFNWKIGKTSKFKRISFRRLVWSNLENKPSMDGCSTVVLFISGRKDWRIWISLGGISGIWISLGGIFYFLCRWHTSVPSKLPVLNVSSFCGKHSIPSGFESSEKGTNYQLLWALSKTIVRVFKAFLRCCVMVSNRKDLTIWDHAL